MVRVGHLGIKVRRVVEGEDGRLVAVVDLRVVVRHGDVGSGIRDSDCVVVVRVAFPGSGDWRHEKISSYISICGGGLMMIMMVVVEVVMMGERE